MSIVLLDDRSPHLTYSMDGSWIPTSNTSDFNHTSSTTVTAGASVSLNFNGTAVSVYGGIVAKYEHNSTTAPQSSYVIDGQDPFIFSPELTSADQRQVLFFQANNLTATSHNLVITSLRPQGIFVLDYLSYMSMPSNLDDNMGGSDSGGFHGDPHSKGGDHKSHGNNSSTTDAIVGAVIGTLALIVLAVAAFIGLKYYRKKALNIVPKTRNMDQYQEEMGVGLNPPQYERY